MKNSSRITNVDFLLLVEDLNQGELSTIKQKDIFLTLLINTDPR